MGCGEDMTGLLAPEGCTAGHHRRVDMLIADRCPLQPSAPLLPGALETEIGHHSGHQSLIRQPSLLLKHRPPEKENMVTIDDPAAAVHRQHPVGIAIESEAHGSTTFNHGPAQWLQLS